MRCLRMLVVAVMFAAGPVLAGPYEEAVAALTRKDYPTARKLFLPLATAGDVVPQFYLGTMYDEGRGVLKDDAQATFWYRKAAEQGEEDAQFNLGIMYEKGRGVPKDDQQAYFWWLLASVKGDVSAIKNRDLIEARLTPQQRAAAQAEARVWKPRQPQ